VERLDARRAAEGGGDENGEGDAQGPAHGCADAEREQRQEAERADRAQPGAECDEEPGARRAPEGEQRDERCDSVQRGQAERVVAER
jgi:hypothetical protein